jgi:hypothetical protein
MIKLTISLLNSFTVFSVISKGQSPGSEHWHAVGDVSKWSDSRRTWSGDGESEVCLFVAITIKNVEKDQMDVVSDKRFSHLIGHHTKSLSTVYRLRGGREGERERERGGGREEEREREGGREGERERIKMTPSILQMITSYLHLQPYVGAFGQSSDDYFSNGRAQRLVGEVGGAGEEANQHATLALNSCSQGANEWYFL